MSAVPKRNHYAGLHFNAKSAEKYRDCERNAIGVRLLSKLEIKRFRARIAEIRVERGALK